MNKRIKAALLILGILVIPFFIYKTCGLKEYHRYPGKVAGIEEANVWQKGLKSKGYYAKRYLPIIEYYTKKDTSEFVEGKLNYFFNLDKGDKIIVLERKDDPYKTTVFSFWLYWLNASELITILLIFGVIFGIYLTFIYKKS